MVKRSCTKRRGIEGLSVMLMKHKIHSRAAKKEKESGADLIDLENEYVFDKIKYSQLFGVAQRWFRYVVDQCSKLGLVPFERVSGNTFVRLSRKRLLVHCVAVFVLTAAMIYKLWAMMKFVSSQDVLTIESLMCITLFLVSCVAWSFSLVLVYFSDESLTLLNIWTPYLECVGRNPGNVVGRKSTALQIISFVILGHAVGVVASLISLIFGALPVCIFPVVENVGLIPDLPVPRILWQLIFFPLELMVNMMSMYQGTLSGFMLCMGYNIHAVGLFEVRKVQVADMNSRLKLENMYMELEIYNRSFAN